MGLIDASNVLSIADKIAKKFEFMYMAVVSGAPVGSGKYYEQCHVCPDGDPIVELPTLTLANSSDEAWKWDDTIIDNVANAFVSSVSSSFGVIGGISTHFAQAGLTGSWNQFLNEADNAVNPTNPSTDTGVRVSNFFRRVYSRVGGGTSLLARNVFYDSPLPFVFGTAEIVDSVGGVVQFWDGGDFGDGSANNVADGTNFAATQLQVMPLGNGGTTGGTNLDVDIQGKLEDGTTDTVSVTIPAGSPDGTPIDVGGVTDRFVDVTGVSLGANKGTNGDRFEVQNKEERSVTL